MTLSEAIDTRVQELDTHAQALASTITLTDNVRTLIRAILREDYRAAAEELHTLTDAC